MNYLPYILLLIFTSTFGQNKNKTILLIDEDNTLIDKQTFENKKSNFLIGYNRTENDSLAVYKLYKKMYFGKLDSIENKQIRGLIKKRYNLNLLKNESVVIHFKDTLYSFQKRKDWYESIKRSIPFTNDTVFIPFSQKLYLKRRKKFDEYQKKCIKKLEKFDTKPLYLYNSKDNYGYNNKYVDWKQMDPIINSLFFENKKGIVIFKPDGQFFVKINGDLPMITMKLIKQKDWITPIEDYEKMKIKNEPIGFFGGDFNRSGYRNSGIKFKFGQKFNEAEWIEIYQHHEMNNIDVNCFESASF